MGRLGGAALPPSGEPLRETQGSRGQSDDARSDRVAGQYAVDKRQLILVPRFKKYFAPYIGPETGLSLVEGFPRPASI